MGKMSKFFIELQQHALMLESLTVAELQSLLPANNEWVQNYINELIKAKTNE